MSEADSDPNLPEAPQLFDELIVELPVTFASKESDDRRPALKEFGAVPPVTVGCVGQRPRSGSRVFHASSARRTLWMAASTVMNAGPTEGQKWNSIFELSWWSARSTFSVP